MYRCCKPQRDQITNILLIVFILTSLSIALLQTSISSVWFGGKSVELYLHFPCERKKR